MKAELIVSERSGIRYLHFGSRWIQGAMRLQRPWSLELDYTRDMMAPLVLAPDPRAPRDVLVVGLGAASQLRYLWRHRPQAKFTVIEIDERVVACARLSFKLPDKRVTIEIGDAADVVPALDARFDLVLVDGFDPRGSAGRLDSVAFYLACRERLAPGGFLAVNLISRSRGVGASVARLRVAFADRMLVLPACSSGNTVVLAWRERGPEGSQADWIAAAEALKRETGLDLRATIRGADPGRAAR